MNYWTEILESPLSKAVGWTLTHFLWQAVALALSLKGLLALSFFRDPRRRYVASAGALLLCMVVSTVTMLQELAFYRDTRFFPDSSDTTGMARVLSGAYWAEQASSTIETALPWLVLLWGCGVAVLSVRLLGGWAFTQHLKYHLLRPVAPWFAELATLVQERVKVAKVVRVFESAAAASPIVVGWLKPVILIPTSAMTGFSREQLETILAHEFAHIRRHDYLVNLLQNFTETVFFFHPCVWWMNRQIRTEREHCCDDIAVKACGHELEYAEALASLAEQRRASVEFALSAGGGALFSRIQRMLSGAGPASALSRPTAALAGIVSLVLFSTVAVHAYLQREERPLPEGDSPYAAMSRKWPERYRRPVTVKWENAPLGTIVASLTTQTGLVIPLPRGTEDELMTVRFDGAPLHMALDAILNRARIGWRLVGNDQITTFPWSNREYWLSRWRTEAHGRETEKDYFLPGHNPVVYLVRKARLIDALKVIGAQMGLRLTVPRAEAGRVVSARFHETLARDALAELLSPHGLDYRILNDAEMEIFRP